MSEYYFYGLVAPMYLATCWTFSAVSSSSVLVGVISKQEKNPKQIISNK